MHFPNRLVRFPLRERRTGRFSFSDWDWKKRSLGLFTALFFVCPLAKAGDPLQKVEAESPVRESASEKWRYFLYLPEGYEKGEEERFPCLFWLHGRSLRGDDLEKTRRYGPPAMLMRKGDYPMIVICPQLPDGAWPADGLKGLLDECLETYRIDPDRVILMGASLGAMGAWNFAGSYPDSFAGLVTICAHGPDRVAEKVVDLPIRAVHGDADAIVPMGPHVKLIERIRELGGNAEIEIVPGGDHGSVIGPSYRDGKWIEWMLDQKRPDAE